jgi:hypothetical protein
MGHEAQEYRYFKAPHVRNEKRAYYDAIDQDVHVRAKRNPANLPEPWDDHHTAIIRDKARFQRKFGRQSWISYGK